MIVTNPGPKAAYLIAAWQIKAPEHLQAFIEQVVPLAEKAGFELLANNTPQWLEGLWPYSGVVIVQRYSSMVALQAFWHSPQHQAIKVLPHHAIESHFVIAVEAS